MSLYDLPNSTSGMDAILVDTSTAVPAFVPMLLLFVFFVVLLGGSNSQRKRTGNSDIPLWATIASISTLMVALPMTLTTGMISKSLLAILVVIIIMCGLWFFLSRNKYEM
jgi:uncharacterized membrane protein YoaK (UPF0700 family)